MIRPLLLCHTRTANQPSRLLPTHNSFVSATRWLSACLSACLPPACLLACPLVRFLLGQVMICNAVAMRLAEFFENPNEYMPDRWMDDEKRKVG